MEVTTFLTQLWGPVILALGVGMIMNRSHYVRLYRDLEKETLAVLLFGMVALVAGIIHVSVHNVWGSLEEILITLLGWALLLKGAAFIIAPKYVDQKGNWIVNSKLIQGITVVVLVAGAYLTLLGYFA